MKRALKILAAVVALLVVAVVAAVLFIDVDALVDARRPEIQQRASDALGREVTVGDIDARLVPVFGATISDVKIAGRAQGAPPLLRVGSAELRFSLWQALVTMGKELEVVALELKDVEANLARDADGVWSFQDILDKQAEKKADEPAEKDQAPADLSFLEGARIARAAIVGADITLDDKKLGRPLAVKDLTLALHDIKLGAPLEAKLDLTLVDGSKATPVSLTARMAELPRDLSFDPVPEISAALNLGDLDVAPWGGLLPEGAMAPVAGTLRADVKVEAGAGLERFKAKGSVKASSLVLGQGEARGEPLEADVQLDVEADTKAPSYRVHSLTVKGTGLDVSGNMQAKQPSLPGLEQADVKLRVADLGRLLAVLPPGAAALPEELSLAGPLSAALSGNADAVDLSVSLDDAHVKWAEAFDKPAGKALNLKLKGKKQGELLVVEPFALVIDTATVGGKLGLPLDPSAPMTADIKSGDISLASLQSIVPPFREAIGKGNRVAGTVSLTAQASVAGGKQQASAVVNLASLDVNLADASARGAGKIEANVAPSGDLVDASMIADLSGMALSSVSGGQQALDKPAGMPLRLDVAVAKGAARADVKQASITFGQTRVAATGNATGLDGENPAISLDFGNVDVKFDDVRKTVPGASALPAGGALRGKVKVTGAPKALATLEVVMSDLDLAFGETSLKGNVVVKNLETPEVKADLPALKVSFDDLRALSEGAKAVPAGGRFEGGVKVAVDTGDLSTLDSELRVGLLKLGRSDLAGTAKLQDLDKPRFAFDFSGDEVDVDQLLEMMGGDDDADAAKPEAPEKKRDNPHGLSKSARENLRGVNGQGSIKAKRVTFEGLPMEDFVGKLAVKNGVVTFDALDFKIYDGRVSAAGTRFDLPAEYTGYDLKLAVKKLDLAQALAAHTSMGGVFRGEVSQNIDLKGKGLAKQDLVAYLEGPTRWQAASLTLGSLDVLAPILDILKKAQGAGGPKIAGASTPGTELKDIDAMLLILGGKMKLEKPIESKTPFGAMALAGTAGLDKKLDLDAIVKLSPATIAKWTGNKVKPASAVDVPMKIGGTWERPVITGIDGGKLVQSVLGAAFGGSVEDAKKLAEAEAKKLADEAEKQAKAELDKKKAEAEKAAQKAAGDAKKQADKAAADAKKKAEAEKKKAEAEAKKKADEAKKKAEKEAKKKADEAKKKAGKALGF